MTSFVDLVDDIIFALIEQVETERDLNSLSRTTRRLRDILTAPLYSRHVRLHRGVALAWVAEYNRVDTAERLLEAGADAMVSGNELDGGMYPLFIAAKFGNTAMVKLLLETEGACPDNFASDTTPLAIGAKRGHVDVVKLLLPRADPRICDEFGKNELVYGAEFGHTEIVKLFIQDGRIGPSIPNILGACHTW
ncbi:uncharacterized protein DNG_04384 [Cephalotrichum gorgonifer]|uniref:Ankyrin n=1 Tax=Cephalotrichum gorgonifer TaxID=2041049 RepID=A0AAE8SUH9_9PEZI|nr:uncharacterized protein DNG_04384 [Cephalotrichum gorgonifer]